MADQGLKTPMDVDRSANKRRADSNENVSQSPSRPIKKQALVEVVGMEEKDITDIIQNGFGAEGLHLTANEASKFLTAVAKMLEVTKTVLNGTAPCMQQAVREEKRLLSLVFNIPQHVYAQAPRYPPNTDPNTVSSQDKAEAVARAKVSEDNQVAYEVKTLLKHLDIPESPACIFKMNSFLWKVEMPTRNSVGRVLATKHKLRNSKWANVYIRPSISFEERQNLKRLRDQRDYLNSLGGQLYQLRDTKLVWKNDPQFADRTNEAMQTPIPQNWQNPRFTNQNNQFHRQGN